MTEYVVIYERGEDGGWGAYLPDLPGVFALGESREEVEENMEEALAAHVEVMQEQGMPLPEPVHLAGTASV
jgi:predicted RNase H-like HicB family nuclease